MMSSTSTPDLASVASTSINNYNNLVSAAATSGGVNGNNYPMGGHLHYSSGANIGGSSPDLVSRRNLPSSTHNLSAANGGFSLEDLTANQAVNAAVDATAADSNQLAAGAGE